MSINSDFLLVDNSAATAAKLWSGGPGTIILYSSNWNSATATFQISADGTNYVAPGAESVFTADEAINFNIPSGHYMKVVISGSPTALYAQVTDI